MHFLQHPDLNVKLLGNFPHTTATVLQNYDASVDRGVIQLSVIASITAPGLLVKRVQVGNDQEKAQSERNSHSKNRGG